MKESLLTLDIPQDLLEQAKSAHVDIRQIVIEALSHEVARLQQFSALDENALGLAYPSEDAIEHAVLKSLEQVASGAPGLRILGLNASTMTMSDDFDDELPDEFWFGHEA